MSDESQDTTLVRHLSMRFFSLSTASMGGLAMA
jgi:hypothetical protein